MIMLASKMLVALLKCQPNIINNDYVIILQYNKPMYS